MFYAASGLPDGGIFFFWLFASGFSGALNIMHFYSIFTQNTSNHE